MATLYCPKCGYNLSNLPENRCPECGKGFDPVGLASEQKKVVGAAKSVLTEILFMPLAFAFMAFFSILFFVAGAGMIGYVPMIVGYVLGLVMVAVVLGPPIWHGCYLGRRHARAKKYRAEEHVRSTARPAWVYSVLFASAECVLMTFYFAGGCTAIILVIQ